MKQLVVGMGEIGKALFKVLSEHYDVSSYDQLERSFDFREPFDVLHVCFGHKAGEIEDFKDWVRGYQKMFLKEGGLTVIHSTVAVGVSRALEAVHSPIRGQHPDLEGGIRTFVKFLGGERAGEAAEIFRKAGLRTYIFDDPETTELGKISETTFYALMIEYIKHLKRECDKYGLSFTEVYTEQARAYREGWEKMGRSDYTMPLLIPIMKQQGGHCTIPNCHLWETPFTEFIRECNEKV